MARKTVFSITSALVFISGIIPSISGLWLFIPWFSEGHTIQSTDYMLYIYSLPVFVFLSVLRIIAFKKNISWKPQLISVLLALSISVIMLFLVPYDIYEIFGYRIVNQVIYPLIYLAALSAIAVNLVYICKDMKKKLYVLPVSALILSVITFILYCFPYVSIGIHKPTDENEALYIEDIDIHAYGNFGLPIPKQTQKELTEIVSATVKTKNEIIADYDYGSISVNVYVENEKTTVIYNGTVVNKSTNETEDYNKKLVFDFAPAKNISN